MRKKAELNYDQQYAEKSGYLQMTASVVVAKGRTVLQQHGRDIVAQADGFCSTTEARFLYYLLASPLNEEKIISLDDRIKLIASIEAIQTVRPELLNKPQWLIDHCRKCMSSKYWPYLEDPLQFKSDQTGKVRVSFRGDSYANKVPTFPDGVPLEEVFNAPRSEGSREYTPIGYTSETVKKVLYNSSILAIALAFTDNPYNALTVADEGNKVFYTGVLRCRTSQEPGCSWENREVRISEKDGTINGHNAIFFLMEQTNMSLYQTVDTLIDAFQPDVPLRTKSYPNKNLVTRIGVCNNPDLIDHLHAAPADQLSVSYELIKK